MKLPNQLPLAFLCSLLFLLLALQPIPTVASSVEDPTTQSNNTSITENKDLELSYINTSCGATLYPEVCYHSLSRYASAVQQDPARLATAAMALSLSRARRLSHYITNASRQADYGSDHRASAAIHDCSSNIRDAVDEIRDSIKQMGAVGSASSSAEEFRFQMSNVQTWMSAALTDEETCTDGFQDVSDGPLKTDVCNRVGDVKKITSNALALVNSYVIGKTS